MWNHKRLQIPKQSWEWTTKLERSHFLISNYITKYSIWNSMEQWNRIKSSEISPCIISQLIFHKGAKNIFSEKRLFNKRYWVKLVIHMRRIKLDSHLISLTKIHLKCIKDLNLRPETIKLLEENTAFLWQAPWPRFWQKIFG